MRKTRQIIGFAGVTNGGKTTICRRLKESLQNQGVDVTLFNMDDYYWHESKLNHLLLPEFDYKIANWDDVSAIDWHRLNSDVTLWKSQTTSRVEDDTKQALLVEGIMIFNNRELLAHFDNKYFFTLSKDECWERRRKRDYVHKEPEGYFEQIVWPGYIKMKDEINSRVDIAYIDGTRDQDDISDEVQRQIMELFFYHK